MSFHVTQLGLSWLAGSLTTLSPCVFPLLPLVLGGAVQGNRWAPVFMGLGMALSFALIGMGLGWLGPLLGVDTEDVRFVGGALLVLLGLVMWLPAASAQFALWMQPLATRANHLSNQFNAGSNTGALGLGAILGLVWTPCSGPLLASALTLAASEGGVWQGGALLGVFGLGAATPLVAVAYASRRGIQSTQAGVLRFADRLKKGFGLVIALTGLAILTGLDKRLEAWVLSVMPEVWLRMTTWM
jgi:cytochrome c biogenesis protein CcdA